MHICSYTLNKFVNILTDVVFVGFFQIYLTYLTIKRIYHSLLTNFMFLFLTTEQQTRYRDLKKKHNSSCSNKQEPA